jgi:hypothetical protein
MKKKSQKNPEDILTTECHVGVKLDIIVNAM